MFINKFFTKKIYFNSKIKILIGYSLKTQLNIICHSVIKIFIKTIFTFRNSKTIDENFIKNNFFFDQDDDLNINNVMFKELQNWVVNDPLSRNDKILVILEKKQGPFLRPKHN